MLSDSCSTGWLTHWGQAMANTSAQEMTSAFTKILKYGKGTGSVNLYMAHGGTNFGFWAGDTLHHPYPPTHLVKLAASQLPVRVLFAMACTLWVMYESRKLPFGLNSARFGRLNQ